MWIWPTNDCKEILLPVSQFNTSNGSGVKKKLFRKGVRVYTCLIKNSPYILTNQKEWNFQNDQFFLKVLFLLDLFNFILDWYFSFLLLQCIYLSSIVVILRWTNDLNNWI